MQAAPHDWWRDNFYDPVPTLRPDGHWLYWAHDRGWHYPLVETGFFHTDLSGEVLGLANVPPMSRA